MSKVSPTTSKAAARASKTSTASAKPASNKGGLPVPLMIGIGVFIAILGIVAFFFLGGDKQPVEQNVEVVVPQSDELNTGEGSTVILPVDNSLNPVVMDEQALLDDPFLAADPINAVTESAVTTAITADPSYTENVGLLMPDQTMFAVGTPDFNALKQEVGSPVHGDLSAMITSQETASGQVWMFNDVSGGEGPIPIATQEAKAKAMRFAVQSANNHLQKVKERYSQPVTTVPVVGAVDPNQPPQVQVIAEPVQRIVEVNSINDEERLLLNSIVQELRTQNQSTKLELEAAKEDKKATERELVQLRQRVENNPALKTAIQATMLPKSSGYKLEAVMGDKIFLRNTTTDESVIVQQGHRIPNTNLSISSADTDTGIVLVTPAK